MPKESNRIVFPPEGWTNSLTADFVGSDQFGNGLVYDTQYGGQPLMRLIYDARDYEITVRCLRCEEQPQAFGRFVARPMIGIVSINATELLVPMNTPRIMRHLSEVHDETIDGIGEVDLYNCLLDSCEL
jgi:hypothetical protein